MVINGHTTPFPQCSVSCRGRLLYLVTYVPCTLHKRCDSGAKRFMVYIPTPNQELKGSTSCIYLETDLSNVFGLKSITTLAADGKNTL